MTNRLAAAPTRGPSEVNPARQGRDVATPSGDMQRMANAAPLVRRLQALQRAADLRGGAVAQRRSDYDGILPAHDTYGDGYSMLDSGGKTERKDKFTYHHIIPENKLVKVTKHLEEIKDHLKTNDAGGKQAFDSSMGAMTGNARAVWAKTRARNFVHYANAQFGDFGVALTEDQAAAVIATHDRDLDGLFSGFRELCKAQILQRTPYAPPQASSLLKDFISDDGNYNALDRPEPDLSTLVQVLHPHYHDIPAVTSAAPEALKEARAGVRKGSNKGAYLRVLTSIVKTRDRDAWFASAYTTIVQTTSGSGTLKQMVSRYAAPHDESKELEHAVQWNPGNIHRGPESKLRDSGGSDLEKLVNDGGDEFEVAAANIVSTEHYEALVAAHGKIDAFLAAHGETKPGTPAYDRKIADAADLVEAMVKVQGFGTTAFQEDQWEQKGKKMNLKLQEDKIRAAGLGDRLDKGKH